MDFTNPNRLTNDLGVVVSSSNLRLTGRIAEFTGNSKITTDLTIPAPGYPLSIRLKYKEASMVTSRQVLVAAPWCRRAESVSMVIFVELNVVGFEVQNWYGVVEHIAIPTDVSMLVGFLTDVWGGEWGWMGDLAQSVERLPKMGLFLELGGVFFRSQQVHYDWYKRLKD